MSLPGLLRLVGLLLVPVLLLAGCGAEQAGKDRDPDRLPDVTLDALDGDDQLALRELRGPMVINLWASWCVPCRKELPHYQAFAEKYDDRVDVLGIDFQDTRPAAARALARETGVQYPLFSDPDGDLRAIGLPKLILLDGRGRVTHEEYVEIESVGQLERLVRKHLGGSHLETS
jgi:cytochrome c biogenesis protein CcmG, thiol:disulfide interchange protein DsbE